MDLIKSSGRRLRRLSQGQGNQDAHQSGCLKARRIGTGSTLKPYDENVVSAMDASGVPGPLMHSSMTTYSENERGVMIDDLATLRAENRARAATPTFPSPSTYHFTRQPLPKPDMDEPLPIDAPPNASSNQPKPDIDVNTVFRGSARRREGGAEGEARPAARGEHDVASASCERNQRSGNYERPSRMVLLDELYSTMAAGPNRLRQSPMYSKRSTFTQVQTSQAEIMDSEMIQINNSNQVAKMQCHSGPHRENGSLLHDGVGSESPTLRSTSSTRAILTRERDIPERPVTKTDTPSRDPVALARPFGHGTPPSSKKSAEKHTKHTLPALTVSAPCPPPTKPLPKVPSTAILRSQSPTLDMSSEASPKAIISCEDSPTLGLYRRHIQQPRSREHLLSIATDDNRASQYEGEASTYVESDMVDLAPNLKPEHFVQLPAQSYIDNSHHVKRLSRLEKADAGVTNHQGRHPRPDISDTRMNVAWQGERIECSHDGRHSNSQSVQWMVDHHGTKTVPSCTNEESETPSLGSSVETEKSQSQNLAQHDRIARKANSQHAGEAIVSYNHRLAAIHQNTRREVDVCHRDVMRSLQDRVLMLEQQNQNLHAYILGTLGLGTI